MGWARQGKICRPTILAREGQSVIENKNLMHWPRKQGMWIVGWVRGVCCFVFAFSLRLSFLTRLGSLLFFLILRVRPV